MAQAYAGDINAAFRGGGRAVEFLYQINQACVLMLEATGILPRALAAQIAAGILKVEAEAKTQPPRFSADYLDYEPRLIAAVGPEASRLHAGRSRQDLSSTIARMNLRDGLIAQGEALAQARQKLLALAAAHTDTIIPAYTHGVQAQPTTFAHYLLALVSALTRQSERLRQAYARVNLCPLGTAALGTSSFPLDRGQLSDALAFDGLLENAYDANHLAPVDAALDVAAALAIAAVQIGMFAQDMHAPYADAQPWVQLAKGKLTGVSSIMPQKRNPAALEQLRVQSSLLLGEAQGAFLVAHNVRTGMFDYRGYDPMPAGRALTVFSLLNQVAEGLVVDRERALAEVRADYSTTTEIADALLQRAEVPFRIGHHFASTLTDYGRSRKLALHQIPYAEAVRLYRDDTQQDFPLSEAEFREVTSAEYMVYGRVGIGGSQPAEITRMLKAEGELAASDLAWAQGQRARLETAAQQLEQRCAQLAQQQ